MNKTLISILTAASVGVVVNLFSGQSALAWFQICNNSSENVKVAFAYLETPDSRNYCDIFGSCYPIRGQTWMTQGWTYLSNGQCQQVYPHELRKRNSHYYVYAESTDGMYSWAGNNSFCVAPTKERFTLAAADQRCNEEKGAQWRDFKEVYTGNARNFTFRITD